MVNQGPGKVPRMVTNGDAWRRTVIPSLLTAVITSSGLIGYWQINPPRPDPFTGEEATELRLEIEAKLERQRRELIGRMINMETDDQYLAKQQQEMWQALAKLPPERWQRRIEALEDWALKSGDPNYQKPD